MAKVISQSKKIRDTISWAHDKLGKQKKNGSNVGNYLADVFFWQEVASLADTELKRAWKTLQSLDGPLAVSDDKLREDGVGEHIVLEDDHFSVLTTVNNPARRFDRDVFINALVKTFKLDRADLKALAENAKTETKSSLRKRVVEV